MHDLFKAVSISHHTAPVEIREQLALNNEEALQVLTRINDLYALRDVLVLSTCNRTEVYYASDRDLGAELIKLLAFQKNLHTVKKLSPYFKNINDHQQAVNHLIRVTTGLDSQIIGDLQITNQVKTAYQLSADLDMAGPFLHRLLHTAFFANKRAVQETAFRDGAASVSYAAVELIDELTAAIDQPTVLIVGVGAIGSDVVRNISDHKNFTRHRVLLANRTLSKAEELAAACGYQAVDFNNLKAHLMEADLMVSAINHSQTMIRKEHLANRRLHGFKYFIDLGVPRSIDTSIEEVNGVVLYNIDDIQSRADRVLQQRLAAIPQVEALIHEAVVGFNDWSKDMSVSPTINKLKNALEQIRQEEIARHLKNATDAQSKIVDKVTKSMMQKVIKLPVLQLKAACRRGDAETLIDVLNDLFDLEKEAKRSREQ